MTKDQLEAAIKVAEGQIEAMTNEVIRRNMALKMRSYADLIGGCVTAIEYYKKKIEELEKPTRKKEVTNV